MVNFSLEIKRGEVWGVAIVHTRQTDKKTLELEHTWHEGHYLAAMTRLLMRRPYRKIKRAIAI